MIVVKIIAFILSTLLVMLSFHNDETKYRSDQNSTTGWAILMWFAHLAIFFVEC